MVGFRIQRSDGTITEGLNASGSWDDWHSIARPTSWCGGFSRRSRVPLRSTERLAAVATLPTFREFRSTSSTQRPEGRAVPDSSLLSWRHGLPPGGEATTPRSGRLPISQVPSAQPSTRPWGAAASAWLTTPMRTPTSERSTTSPVTAPNSEPTSVGPSRAWAVPTYPTKTYVKQVYLIGSTMRGIWRTYPIDDLFEITAEAMYHFLVTESGCRSRESMRPIPTGRWRRGSIPQGRAATAALGLPGWCSLGNLPTAPHSKVRRLVCHPRLLQQPDDLRGIARNHELTMRLIDAATSTNIETQSVEVDDEVLDFLDIAEQGMAEMQRAGDLRTAQSLIGTLTRSSPSVVGPFAVRPWHRIGGS